MNQHVRSIILLVGVALLTLSWLAATAMSPDGQVSAEFGLMELSLLLFAGVVAFLWPQPVVVPPLTEEQLSALLDGRYLRVDQPVPEHTHGVYADVGHTHPGYASEAHVHHEVHDHPTDSADPTVGPRTGAPDYNVVQAAAPVGAGPRVI